jgi:hypothetical protein
MFPMRPLTRLAAIDEAEALRASTKSDIRTVLDLAQDAIAEVIIAIVLTIRLVNGLSIASLVLQSLLPPEVVQ